MPIDIGKIINIAGAVNDALHVEAQKPTNSLQPSEVHSVAPAVAAKVEAKVEAQVKPVVEVLTNQEPWWKSPQAIAQIVALISMILGIFKISFPAEMQAQFVILIMTLISAGTAAVLFWNRYIRPSQLLRKLRGEP